MQIADGSWVLLTDPSERLQTDAFVRLPVSSEETAAISHAPGVALVSDQPIGFDAEGTFSLHGVSRRIRVHIDATYRAGARVIEFQTEFPVTLEDYKISRPEFLFMKLAQTQDVRVSAVASAPH